MGDSDYFGLDEDYAVAEGMCVICDTGYDLLQCSCGMTMCVKCARTYDNCPGCTTGAMNRKPDPNISAKMLLSKQLQLCKANSEALRISGLVVDRERQLVKLQADRDELVAMADEYHRKWMETSNDVNRLRAAMLHFQEEAIAYKMEVEIVRDKIEHLLSKDAAFDWMKSCIHTAVHLTRDLCECGGGGPGEGCGYCEIWHALNGTKEGTNAS